MHFDAVFWYMISFIAFIALIYKPVGGFIVRSLDQRAARIETELEEALKLKEEAQALLASYERDQRDALEEVEEILNHAHEEAERITQNAKKHLEEELNKRTEMATQKIAQMEAAIAREIRDNAVDMTMAAVRDLIEKNMNDDLAEEIISKAVADVDRKLN